MAFIRVEGLSGKVFVPDESPEPKKHPCPDCYDCQHCGDDRCRMCRGESAEDAAPCDRCCGGIQVVEEKGPSGQGSGGNEKRSR
jgi:hypothetical protein